MFTGWCVRHPANIKHVVARDRRPFRDCGAETIIIAPDSPLSRAAWRSRSPPYGLVRPYTIGASLEIRVAVSLHCESWYCERCYPRRLRELIALILAGWFTHFITLTIRPDIGRSPEDRARLLKAAHAKLIRLIRRLYGRNAYEYLDVFEANLRGEPHLHIYARCPFIPQQWLRDTMVELIGSPGVDIRGVASRDDRRQAAKYISPHKFGNLNRYSASSNWIIDPSFVKHRGYRPNTSLPSGWTRTSIHYSHYARQWFGRPGFEWRIGRTAWGEIPDTS